MPIEASMGSCYDRVPFLHRIYLTLAAPVLYEAPSHVLTTMTTPVDQSMAAMILSVMAAMLNKGVFLIFPIPSKIKL